MENEFKLDIWRCHPKSIRIVSAEKTLAGTANEAGVKWCRPYSSVNQLGWWVFPPVDVDIKLTGAGFERNFIELYSDSDHHLVKSLLRSSDNTDIEKWCPSNGGRSKFNFGDVEPNIVQIWTGVILRTPPGWVLQIRSPINFQRRKAMCVMEGILETDWMQYDLWINMVFDHKDEWVHLRKDEFPPLAQLIPIRRESVDADWSINHDEIINRNSPEANRVFEFWVDYNNKKFGKGGKQSATRDGSVTKDSTTFFKERMKHLGKGVEPIAEQMSYSPISTKKCLKLKNKLIT